MVSSATRTKDILVDRGTAEALRHLRWSRGLSMDQCAAAIDVPLLQFLAKERGRTPFTRLEFRLLLDVLQTTEADLEKSSLEAATA
ncbi:MAG: hypothetical protein ABL904_10045 [Hyphomicrobiaceae bacterium]